MKAKSIKAILVTVLLTFSASAVYACSCSSQEDDLKKAQDLLKSCWVFCSVERTLVKVARHNLANCNALCESWEYSGGV